MDNKKIRNYAFGFVAMVFLAGSAFSRKVNADVTDGCTVDPNSSTQRCIGTSICTYYGTCGLVDVPAKDNIPAHKACACTVKPVVPNAGAAEKNIGAVLTDN